MVNQNRQTTMPYFDQLVRKFSQPSYRAASQCEAEQPFQSRPIDVDINKWKINQNQN